MKYVDKPWGHEIIWASTDNYLGKILSIKAGHMMSLQYHEQKDETFYVYKGKVDTLIEDSNGVMKSKIVSECSNFHIPAGVKHRIIAIEDSELLEVSTPYPNDLIRIEDKYGR